MFGCVRKRGRVERERERARERESERKRWTPTQAFPEEVERPAYTFYVAGYS